MWLLIPSPRQVKAGNFTITNDIINTTERSFYENEQTMEKIKSTDSKD